MLAHLKTRAAMEFREKRKIFSLRPPARKGREILGWVQWVKWCPHIGQQMHCWQTVAAGSFWPCFACPKLGYAGRTRVGKLIHQLIIVCLIRIAYMIILIQGRDDQWWAEIAKVMWQKTVISLVNERGIIGQARNLHVWHGVCHLQLRFFRSFIFFSRTSAWLSPLSP